MSVNELVDDFVNDPLTDKQAAIFYEKFAFRWYLAEFGL